MQQLKEGLSEYFFIPGFAWTDVVEIIIIAFLLYQLVAWIRKVRAGALLKGLILLFICYAVTVFFNMSVLSWLLEKTFSVGIVALVVLFQPELRQVLEQIGRKYLIFDWFKFGDKNDGNQRFSDKTIDAIVNASFEMGKVKTGALIVIEQDVSLESYANTGIAMDALVSKQLLVQMFEHNTPLHDGAVIIKGNRVVSATCYLPLSYNTNISKDLGTRHRAGIGISEETDSYTIIVSEETGSVSLAVGGELIRNIDRESLKSKLSYIQKNTVDVQKFKLWKGKQRLEAQTQKEKEDKKS